MPTTVSATQKRPEFIELSKNLISRVPDTQKFFKFILNAADLIHNLGRKEEPDLKSLHFYIITFSQQVCLPLVSKGDPDPVTVSEGLYEIFDFSGAEGLNRLIRKTLEGLSLEMEDLIYSDDQMKDFSDGIMILNFLLLQFNELEYTGSKAA